MPSIKDSWPARVRLTHQLIPAPCLVNTAYLVLSVSKEADVPIAPWEVFAHDCAIPADVQSFQLDLFWGLNPHEHVPLQVRT